MDYVIGSIHTFAPLARPAFPLTGVAVDGINHGTIIDLGTLQITGTTANVGVPQGVPQGAANAPVGRRVRLHDQPSGRVVAEQWSDPVTGAYAFTHLRPGTFYVMGFDHTGQYDGDSETDVQSEPAP